MDVERKRASLDRHNTLISGLSQKQEIYNNNKEAIENLEKLLKEKQLYVNKSKSIEEQIKSNSEEKINFYKSLGSEEQRIENLEQDKVEFESIRSEYSSYDLFLRCMHPNGIGYDIIKQKLPIINEEIAKILANVVDFEIF